MAQTPLSDYFRWLPPEGIKIVVVLFLSFLVGLEREEHKVATRYSFGGVRTFPLIGLIGYTVAFLSKSSMWISGRWACRRLCPRAARSGPR